MLSDACLPDNVALLLLYAVVLCEMAERCCVWSCVYREGGRREECVCGVCGVDFEKMFLGGIVVERHICVMITVASYS